MNQKLLFLVTEDWYFCSHRLPLAIAALEAGFDVAVATRVREHGQIIQDAGISVIPFELSRRGGNPLMEIVRLVRLYLRERPAIIHHVAMKPVLYGSIAARLSCVRNVVNAVAGLGWLFISGGIAAQMLRPVVRSLLVHLLAAPGMRSIVQNSDDLMLLIKLGVPQDRLHLIRGAGVDTVAFAPTAEPAGSVTVVLVARMLWDKGVGEFVEAAKHLYDEGIKARFVLVGVPDPANPSAVPLDTLRGWNGKFGVEWWGHRADMPQVLADAHIVCLPSYREGLPKTLLEAAACGRPIVTSDAPGCREIVRDGDNGLLVPVKDATALAVALKSLIINKDLRYKMGVRGRERVLKEFTMEKVIEETLMVYRELVS